MEPDRLLNDRWWEPVAAVADSLHPVGYRSDAAGNAKNLAGTHHCLVAEIAYSLAPIPTTTATGAAPNPLTWDQLAQRNLQITLSENPKARATHIVGQAFDIRPSKPLAPMHGTLLDLPDELMIDWGKTPVGSEVTIS